MEIWYAVASMITGFAGIFSGIAAVVGYLEDDHTGKVKLMAVLTLTLILTSYLLALGAS